MATNLLRVRHYQGTDLPMIRNWWAGHREGEFPAKILPPLGVVVECDGEPRAALWLYMAVNVGVCFAEFAVSRPGLSLAESREAFRCAVGALEAAALANDYNLMICHTVPGIARVMRNFGFHADKLPMVSTVKILT